MVRSLSTAVASLRVYSSLLCFSLSFLSRHCLHILISQRLSVLSLFIVSVFGCSLIWQGGRTMYGYKFVRENGLTFVLCLHKTCILSFVSNTHRPGLSYSSRFFYSLFSRFAFCHSFQCVGLCFFNCWLYHFFLENDHVGSNFKSSLHGFRVIFVGGSFSLSSTLGVGDGFLVFARMANSFWRDVRVVVSVSIWR